MPEVLEINSSIRVPHSEFSFTYSRSSGPGGQNVNKVNSKAQLRWRVSTSPSVPDDVRARLLELFASRVTVDGEFVIASERSRNQEQNVEDCLEKLRQMLLAAAVKPKSRRATKPTRGSRLRREAAKRENSQRKQSRKPPNLGE